VVVTADAVDALRAAAAIGPYFAVDMAAGSADWVGLDVLIAEPDLLRERVAVARALLADRCGLAPDAVDERATASIHFLGLTARLICPAFGAAVLTGTVPVLDPAEVYWQRTDGGPIPVALTGTQTATAGAVALADVIYDVVVSTVIAPVAEQVQREFGLSPHVVWGNVASALGGAATMLGTARPHLADHAQRIAERLLQLGALADTGHFVAPGPARGQTHFVRHNCCLFYRIPGGGTCADCVLRSDQRGVAAGGGRPSAE
jgi:ferric iron reductase protein FhuF